MTHHTLALLVLVWLTGCAADLPTAPSPSPQNTGTLTVAVNPSAVLFSGSSVQVRAVVRTTAGSVRIGAQVRFITSSGTMKPSEQTTDTSGEAIATLTASSSATVTVTSDDRTEQVTVQAIAPFRVEIAQSFDATIYTDQWMAPIAVTANSDAVDPPRPARVTLDCGTATRTIDGFLGTQTVPCSFGQPGAYTVRATATAANGWSTSCQRQVTAVDRPRSPMAVFLDAARVSSDTLDFTAYAEPYEYQNPPPVRCDWTFGDGQSLTTTTCRDVRHSYASRGIVTVTVRLTAANGTRAETTSQFIVQ